MSKDAVYRAILACSGLVLLGLGCLPATIYCPELMGYLLLIGGFCLLIGSLTYEKGKPC